MQNTIESPAETSAPKTSRRWMKLAGAALALGVATTGISTVATAEPAQAVSVGYAGSEFYLAVNATDVAMVEAGGAATMAAITCAMSSGAACAAAGVVAAIILAGKNPDACPRPGWIQRYFVTGDGNVTRIDCVRG